MNGGISRNPRSGSCNERNCYDCYDDGRGSRRGDRLWCSSREREGKRERALRETLSGLRAFCPVARKDSMFSLKGRFSEDISSGAGDSPASRAIFHSGPSPDAASGRRRPLHKITLLLVRPLR